MLIVSESLPISIFTSRSPCLTCRVSLPSWTMVSWSFSTVVDMSCWAWTTIFSSPFVSSNDISLEPVPSTVLPVPTTSCPKAQL